MEFRPHPDIDGMATQDIAIAIEDAEERLKLADTFEDPVERKEMKAWFVQELRMLRTEQARRNGKGQHTKAEPKALIEIMASIQEEEIDFLWDKRIARGKLTEFLGDAGVGKSYTASAIAAAISNGEALPFDKEPEAPLRSLIISAEDGAADTIKPRLRMLKADMGMIAIPNRAFTPSAINADLIDQMVQQFPAAFIIIDPVIAYAGKRNTDKAGDVRELLMPIQLVAEKHKAAIVLIRHLNKATQSQARYRGQGSVDFDAICRSRFIFAQDADNDQRRLMIHLKSSISKLQPTLEFFIDDNGKFRWGSQTSESADEALGSIKKEREAKQLDTAKRFLEQTLQKGPMASNDVKDLADKAGISWRTVWRAKEELEVRASKSRGTGEWLWRLP